MHGAGIEAGADRQSLAGDEHIGDRLFLDDRSVTAGSLEPDRFMASRPAIPAETTATARMMMRTGLMIFPDGQNVLAAG